MSEALQRQTVEIAKSYLNTILFIDDAVSFGGDIDNRHGLNAQEIIKSFANESILSVFFKYGNEHEKESVLKLIDKSDICVLDWKLTLTSVTPSEDEGEKDVEGAEGRGRHAIALIEKMIGAQHNSPKLIVIYSAEDGDDIPSALESLPNGRYRNFTWDSNDHNIRISVFFKPGLAGAHISAPIKARTIAYEDLPDTVIGEFAGFHCGLLPNAMMKSISAIRKNTNRLLKEFSKQLDSAFVAHRAMCPNPDDGGDLLKVTIADAFDAVLSYEDIPGEVDSKAVKRWIEAQEWSSKKIKLNKKTMMIDKKHLIAWQKQGYPVFLKSIYQKTHSEELPKKVLDDYDKYQLKEKTVDFFSPKQVLSGIHEEFSILTHQKSNFIADGFLPVLTLGVVLLKEDSDYLICIQQKCDSVRVKNGESRNFLFLPLEEVKKGGKSFDLIYKNDSNNFTKFKIINKDCYQIQMVGFKSTNSNGIISAKKEIDGTLVFKDVNKKSYRWLFELNESYAQKIVNEYAACLSRVGINQSEWLRRK